MKQPNESWRYLSFDIHHWERAVRRKPSIQTSTDLAIFSREAWDRMVSLANMYCRTFCIDETAECFEDKWQEGQYRLHQALWELPLDFDDQCPACTITKTIPFMASLIEQTTPDYSGPLFMPFGYPHQSDESKTDQPIRIDFPVYGSRASYFAEAKVIGYPAPEDTEFDYVFKSNYWDGTGIYCEFTCRGKKYQCGPTKMLLALLENRDFQLKLPPIEHSGANELPPFLERIDVQSVRKNMEQAQDIAFRVHRWREISNIEAAGLLNSCVFKQDGKLWQVLYNGTQTKLSPNDGCRYIHILLSRQGETIHAADLKEMVRPSRSYNKKQDEAAQGIVGEEHLAGFRTVDLYGSPEKHMGQHENVKRISDIEQEIEVVREQMEICTATGNENQYANLVEVLHIKAKELDEMKNMKKRDYKNEKDTIRKGLKIVYKELKEANLENLAIHLKNNITIRNNCTYSPAKSIKWLLE